MIFLLVNYVNVYLCVWIGLVGLLFVSCSADDFPLVMLPAVEVSINDTSFFVPDRWWRGPRTPLYVDRQRVTK